MTNKRKKRYYALLNKKVDIISLTNNAYARWDELSAREWSPLLDELMTRLRADTLSYYHTLENIEQELAPLIEEAYMDAKIERGANGEVGVAMFEYVPEEDMNDD